jgi:DNA-binding LacI/PurR family transcriptional regulator
VRAAAHDLGYQVNRAASKLRSGRNPIVTGIVPDLSDRSFASLITEIETRAETVGYELIVANFHDNGDTERSRLDALVSWNPSGRIVFPCLDQLPNRLKEPGVPAYVAADRVSSQTFADTRSIDNGAGGAPATAHLYELGYRKIMPVASDLGQIETMTLADRIVVLQAGNVEQVATLIELYHRPVKKFVAGFIGSPKMSFLNARPRPNGSIHIADGPTIFVPCI